MMRVTNKAETFQLESDDKFLCIFANDEYLESKLQLESIMIDNKTLIDELESSHNSDESLITLSNVIKQQLKLKEEALVEMEKNIQSLENDLFVENEKLKQGYLKSEENDKMMARLIQQLENEAENSRIEVLFGQQTFSEHKIKWNLKYKEELDKLNELKRQESSIDIAPRNLMNDSGSSSKSRSSSQYEKVGSKNRTPTNSSKRKSNSASSALSVKQLKRQSIESGLDEPYTDDEDNVSLLINYRPNFLIVS